MINDILNINKDYVSPDFVVGFDSVDGDGFIFSPSGRFLDGAPDGDVSLRPRDVFKVNDVSALREIVSNSCEGECPKLIFRAKLFVKDVGYKLHTFIMLPYNGETEVKAVALYLFDDGDSSGVTIFSLLPHIVEQSPSPVYLINRNSRIIYANVTATQFLGYSRAKFLTMGVADIDIYADDEGLERFWGKLKKEKLIEFNSIQLAKDGKRLTIHAKIFYFNFEGKEYCCAFTTDISNERKYSGGVLFREMVNRTHFMYLPNPVYVWKSVGDDFLLVDYNYSAEELAPDKLSEFLGISANKFFSQNEVMLSSLHRCLMEKKRIKNDGKLPINISKVQSLFELYYIYIPPHFVFLHAIAVHEERLCDNTKPNFGMMTDENPNPIFKVNSRYELLYKNLASKDMLDAWYVGIGFVLPPVFMQIVDDVLYNKTQISREIVFNEQNFLITAYPVNSYSEVLFSALNIVDQLHIREEVILAEHIFESTIEGVIVCDKNNKIIRVNPAFEKITEYNFEMVRGKNPRILKSGRHGSDFYFSMWSDLISKGRWEGEVWNRKLSGEIYPVRMTINCIRDDCGEIKNYICIFSDISEIKDSEEKILYQSNYDPLTGLPNRKLFNDRLSIALRHSEREELRVALLVVDLDRFKVINDGFGHIVGDFVLQESALRLEKCVGEGNTLARVGEDEFVIIISGISDIGDTTKVSNGILEAFRTPMSIEGNEFFLSVSVGVSIFPDDGTSPVELYKNADIAMLYAKKNGGNNRRFFSPEMNNDMQYKLKIEVELRRALELDQFELFYQPIIDSQNDIIVGAEALIRWRHADFGIIMPNDFIPIAEETGLIVGLNDWVMRRACSDHNLIEKAGYGDLYFSVNMTSHQFSSRKIVDSVFSSMKEFNMPPGNLVIEITEDSILSNVDEVISVMEELSSTGIRFSIDDFGTGYSSLSYLKKFPFDYIKIDRSFVMDLPHDYDSKILAKSIIVLAKELGLRVISEGVEVQTQVDFFRENGSLLVQGYYYSKPLPMNDLLLFLRKYEMLDLSDSE